MAFTFRFASLLALRRRQRDEAGAAIGQANEALRRIDEQTERIAQERISLRSNDRDRRIGQVSVDSMLAHSRYDAQLEVQIRGLKETRGKLIIELERRQELLTIAETELKRFARLEENERTAAQQEQLRREQAEIDEVVGRRITMERRRT